MSILLRFLLNPPHSPPKEAWFKQGLRRAVLVHLVFVSDFEAIE